MTHFAPVAPLLIHRQLDKAHALGDYNLIIASEVMEAPGPHRAFWQNREGFLIMDNGVIELGYPLPLRQLAVAAEMVHASVLVLPDTIDDANMTIKQVRFSNPEWKKLRTDTKTMGVVQGKNFAECVDCADAHVQHGVDYLAIPRGLTPNLGSRYDLTQHIASEHPSIPLHMLGFSENIRDDIHAAVAAPTIMGIDAATPVWMGMGGRRGLLPLDPPRTANYGRRPEWFWQAGEQYGDSLYAIKENLTVVERWLAAAGAGQALLDKMSSGSGPTVVKAAPTDEAGPLAPLDLPTQT